MVSTLIARAFRNVVMCDQTREIFLDYSRRVFMFHQLQERQVVVDNPLELDGFRTLPEADQNLLCKSVADHFGEIFGRLQRICGRARLLEIIEFQEFQQGDPDACHYYIAYLVQEGKLRRIVTTNWDILIEEALRRTSVHPPNQLLNVVFDDRTYATRNDLAPQVYAKVHGSANQYPDEAESIVLTSEDIEAASDPQSWKQRLLYDYLDGTVLFCGYSATDTSIRIPAKAIERRDAAHELAGCSYYFAELNQLGEIATRFTRGEAQKHIRLYANDIFSSLYFGWLIERLKSAIEHERGQGQYHFPRWQNEDWNNILDRVQREIERLVPEWLEATIGAPAVRRWDKSCALIPIILSNITQLASQGQIEHALQYIPLPLETSKTVACLIMLLAVLDVAAQLECTIGAHLDTSFCGLTMLDPSGASRNIILLYGPSPQGALAAIDLYLSGLDRNGPIPPSPEVVIIPCQQYVFQADPLELPDFSQRRLPGELRARKHPISPESTFSSRSFEELVRLLRRELEEAP